MNKRLFDMYVDETSHPSIVFLCNRCKLKCRVHVEHFERVYVESDMTGNIKCWPE